MIAIRNITVLDPDIANKIAAGEVVERPASVVKELVENSLDAGATAITIEIRNGGIDYIRVTDNGCGIPAKDVERAFFRHATSKLFDAEGLECIETLGFRGEALASIAAVSRMTMRTRTKNDESGTVIELEGGGVISCAPCGCPPGTNTEVRDLFFNVPARLKFLKSIRAESAAVGDYVLRLILANTDVSFKFISGGKSVYHSAGDGSLENALVCVYGADIAGHIRQIKYDDGYMMIEGCCGDEYLSRSTRIQQSLYVNGRYIRSQAISYSAQRAYDTRLMTGRFPFFVLNIKLSPREVDVNVHPNKLSVRFRDEERVCMAVSRGIMDAMRGIKDGYAKEAEEKEAPAISSVALSMAMQGKNLQMQADTVSKQRSASVEPSTKYDTLQDVPDIINKPMQDPLYVRDSATTGAAPEDYKINDEIPLYSFEPDKIIEAHTQKQEEMVFDTRPYSIIGTVFETYIIIQQGDAVFYIDQHAAHERILYERLIRDEMRFNSQLLLTPVIIKLTPTEFAVFMDNSDRFRELGFDIEHFGAMSISVHSTPAGVVTDAVERFVRDIIAIVQKQGDVHELEILRASIIQTACKHAVKAGKRLDETEIEDILSCYANGATPLTCPHGRPVLIGLTKKELEKRFKRTL